MNILLKSFKTVKSFTIWNQKNWRIWSNQTKLKYKTWSFLITWIFCWLSLRKLKVPNEEVVYNCVLRRLKVPNEEVVFNCVFNWINFDKKNREQYLPKLMVYVRLPFLSPQFLTDVCDKEIMIKKSFECRDMLDEAKKLYFRRRAEMSGIRIGKDEYLV